MVTSSGPKAQGKSILRLGLIGSLLRNCWAALAGYLVVQQGSLFGYRRPSVATLTFATVRSIPIATHNIYAPKNVWADPAECNVVSVRVAAFTAIDSIGSHFKTPNDVACSRRSWLSGARQRYWPE
jgi:hypothetical protein